MKTIYLPAIKKQVPLGVYLKGIQLAKQNPEATFKHGLTCWWPCTGREIMRQFRDSVNDRINQHGSKI